MGQDNTKPKAPQAAPPGVGDRVSAVPVQTQVAVSPESYLYGQNVTAGTSGKKDDEPVEKVVVVNTAPAIRAQEPEELALSSTLRFVPILASTEAKSKGWFSGNKGKTSKYPYTMNPAAMINIFHDVHAVIRDASGELANEQKRLTTKIKNVETLSAKANTTAQQQLNTMRRFEYDLREADRLKVALDQSRLMVAQVCHSLQILANLLPPDARSDLPPLPSPTQRP